VVHEQKNRLGKAEIDLLKKCSIYLKGASSTASSSSSPSAAMGGQGSMGMQTGGGMNSLQAMDNIRRYRTAFTREQIGVDFTHILRVTFLYKSVLQSFSLITV